jgi:hypothetical protein
MPWSFGSVSTLFGKNSSYIAIFQYQGMQDSDLYEFSVI